MNIESYSVVNFHDGLQAVPTKWIKNKKCAYPSFLKSESRIQRAIRSKLNPQHNWELLDIIKVYGEEYGK